MRLKDVIVAVVVGAAVAAPFASVNLRVQAQSDSYMLGARAGVRVAPVEAYGGVDPVALAVSLDDQVSSHTLPVAVGLRAYVARKSDLDVFLALDGDGWNERMTDGVDQQRRRLHALVGVRSEGRFFYDVAAGAGASGRRRPGESWEVRPVFSAQAGVGVAF